MKSTQSFSDQTVSCGQNSSPEPDIRLMAMAEVLHQEDIELLKQQLAAAHQLLSYRQDVIHALTDQINLKEVCLSHAEQKNLALKYQCDTQQIELSEAQAVCSDLRELLKRQQRRSASQKSHPSQKDTQPVFRVHHREQIQRDTISFGYESAGSAGQPATPLTKAPPVEAWTAQSNTLQGEAMFCQRLTTLVVASSARVSTLSSHPVIDVSAQLMPSQSGSSQRRPVELPRFSMS